MLGYIMLFLKKITSYTKNHNVNNDCIIEKR